MEELANTVADKTMDERYTLDNLLTKATKVEKLAPEPQKDERFEEIKKNLDEQQKTIDQQKKIIEQRLSRDATLSV